MSEALHVAQEKPITLVYIANLLTRFESVLTSNRPVGLKEAALDSPTFRSGVSHLSDQLDLVEKWLDGLVRSISKVSQEIGPLETAINGVLTQSAPPANMSEVIIDHDYTLLAARRYTEGARELWTSTILGMRKMEANVVEPIRSFVQNDLRAFKVCAVVMVLI